MSAASPAPIPAPPQGGAEVLPVQHVPGPSMVPPPRRAKRRTALWGILIALLAVAGGTAVYLNRSQPKPGEAGAGVAIPTMVISMGDLHSTIRVSGTVTAEKFAALLAPRIMGSRGN